MLDLRDEDLESDLDRLVTRLAIWSGQSALNLRLARLSLLSCLAFAEDEVLLRCSNVS
jgi:hypothetical protein